MNQINLITKLTVIGFLVFISCSESDKKNLTIKQMQTGKNEQIDQLKGFKVNIEKETVENKNFRDVLYTASKMQLVLMSLNPGEEIGEEVHPETDQFFRFEAGNGKCIINGISYRVEDGDAIIIPAGAKHNVINTDQSKLLKMYTIYSPPHHKDKLVVKTKKEAEQIHEEFDGVTTEGF